LRYIEKLLVVLWCFSLGAILILSLIPIGAPAGVSDKVLHALAFSFVSALSFLAFRQKRSIVSALAGVVLVGIASEAGQLLVPARHASFLDLLADFVGVALGVPLGMLAAAVMMRLASRIS
jgi:VanZ family protein